MAVTEDQLDDALEALGLVARLSNVADRNPLPPPSGERQKAKLRRRRERAHRHLAELADQAQELLGEVRHLDDELTLLDR